MRQRRDLGGWLGSRARTRVHLGVVHGWRWAARAVGHSGVSGLRAKDRRATGRGRPHDKSGGHAVGAAVRQPLDERPHLKPDGANAANADREHLETINYGGGARWFIKAHLAFSFDVRFYAINPGSAYTFSQSPRTTLLVVGAGVSVK